MLLQILLIVAVSLPSWVEGTGTFNEGTAATEVGRVRMDTYANASCCFCQRPPLIQPGIAGIATLATADAFTYHRMMVVAMVVPTSSSGWTCR